MKSSQAANSVLPSPALCWEHWTHRALGLLPSSTKPRLAGVLVTQAVPEAGKPAAGCGGVGGGLELQRESRSATTTPTPLASAALEPFHAPIT